jgi:hypothetical protein
MPLPYRETFESYGKAGRLARFFSDVEGGFETAPCGGGRSGFCYRQSVTLKPIVWHRARSRPTTVLGDPRWWGDYKVEVDVLLEQEGYVELLGRVSSQRANALEGYHLRVGSAGEWALYSQDIEGGEVKLASGAAPFGVGTWHQLGLRLLGTQIEVFLDGRRLATLSDDRHSTGQIGFSVSPWQNAQFDNVSVTRTAPSPRFIPHGRMRVTATSEHASNHRGYTFAAVNAIDDRPETAWSQGPFGSERKLL